MKKITRKRTPEHNQKIGDSVSKSFTDEHRKLLSERMTQFWKNIKELQQKNEPNKSI